MDKTQQDTAEAIRSAARQAGASGAMDKAQQDAVDAIAEAVEAGMTHQEFCAIIRRLYAEIERENAGGPAGTRAVSGPKAPQ